MNYPRKKSKFFKFSTKPNNLFLQDVHPQLQVSAPEAVAEIPNMLPDQLRVEVLPILPRWAGVLQGNVQSVTAASYVRSTGQLTLKCQFVVVCEDGEVTELRLQVTPARAPARDAGAIAFTRAVSPGVASNHPTLAWAAQARLPVAVDMVVPGLTAGDLLAVVARVGEVDRVFARIYLAG